MIKSEEIQLDFVIDKLANSTKTLTQESFFDTHNSQISKTRNISKLDWVFDWHSEI